MSGDPKAIPWSAVDPSEPRMRRTRPEVLREAVLLVPNIVTLLIRLIADPRVSTRRKVLVGAVVVYVMAPIDVIPDFVIGLGHLDDLVLLSLAVDHLLRGVDESIVLEHWDGSVDGLDLAQSAFAWGADVVPSVMRRLLPG